MLRQVIIRSYPVTLRRGSLKRWKHTTGCFNGYQRTNNAETLLHSKHYLLSTQQRRQGTTLHSGTAVSAKTIIEAHLSPDRHQLYIRWNDDDETNYPYIWLLSNCQCPSCYDTKLQTRTSEFRYLLKENYPIDAKIDSKTQKILVTWKDGHNAEYPYEWLRARSFRAAEQLAKARWKGRPPKLWDSTMAKTMPTFDFNKLLKDDLELYNWITALEESGIAIIKNATMESEQHRPLGDIGKRVAYLRPSNYGEIFTVKTSASPTNLAYTDSVLELHTDYSYYDYIPGIQLLHCYAEAEEGGESHFVDGFAAAYQLKRANLERFRLLTTYPFESFDIGKDATTYHLMASHCAIKLDPVGDVHQIVFNNHMRDSFMSVPLDIVEPLHKALISLYRIFYDPKNMLQFKMQAGDIVCLNNWRVLHGRTAIKKIGSQDRILYGAYIDWDEMHSTRRVLKSKLSIPDEEY